MPYPATPKTWVAGDVLTAAQLNAEVRDALLGAFPLGPPDAAWTAYTPALTAATTNPTLGTGSAAHGRYTRIGRTIIGRAIVAFGTSGVAAGSGSYRFSLPVMPATHTGASPNGGRLIGQAFLWDNSATNVDLGFLWIPSAGVQYAQINTDPTGVTDALPWVWAASDSLEIAFTYEAAT